MASRRPSRRVLLVEPWWAGSHRAWAEGLVAHSRHHFELLTRRPAGWRATIDHAADRLAARVERPPDVVVASSMMDLEAFMRAAGLDDVPTLLYMHENQLTYDRSRPDLERGARNWGSVRRADRVCFNSRFHRDDFFQALPLLGVDPAESVAVRARSTVVPVGIEAGAFIDRPARAAGSAVIVWNHRWEADKDPDTFLTALDAIGELPWRLVLLGDGAGDPRWQFRLRRWHDRTLHAGHAPRTAYTSWLQQSDLVVSTARQEFFGVAVVEAMAAGVVPVVPDRLAYREVLGTGLVECLYREDGLADALAAAVLDQPRTDRLRPIARRRARRFDWPSIVGHYDELIDSMV